MTFETIAEDTTVVPGEYLLHTPTRQIVMCGAFNRSHDLIRALSNGRLIEDKIENFNKILLTKDEKKRRQPRQSCGGCKKI